VPNLLRGLVSFALLIALLFGTAGRWDLPFFWAYVGINAALMLATAFTVDAGLLEERWHPARRGGKDFLPLLLVGTPAYLAHYVIAGLDVGRFHWSDRVPPGVQIAGLAVYGASWALVWRAMTVNRFFVETIRVQTERGHHLVTAGPYQYVRHPGYAGAIAGFLGSPLGLGSYWSLVPVVPIVLLVIRRTILEDRLLRNDLPGYSEYAGRVRYRLFPGLW
jgi:protein-S-isoprenylcysteine O-methyltransferase Ste14